MKKNKRDTLEKRLKAYSAAAAGALLLTPSADAAVRYFNPPDIVVDSGNPSVFLNLDNNGTNDFQLVYTSVINGVGHVINGVNTSNWVINSGTFQPGSVSPNVSKSVLFNANLPTNYSIQSLLTFPYSWVNSGFPDVYVYTGRPVDTLGLKPAAPSYQTGNFNGITGFLGVSFIADCGRAFGWIRYGASADSSQGTIMDWAYQDNCGTAILAGEIAAPAVPAPTLNQWGLFILIALLAGAGISVLRKQEEV